MRTVQTNSRPSARQLRYLKLLAQRTATTFAYPSTKAHASRQIERLEGLRQSGRPLPEHRHHETDGLQYATAMQDGEMAGRGSSARLRHHRHDENNHGSAGGYSRFCRTSATTTASTEAHDECRSIIDIDTSRIRSR